LPGVLEKNLDLLKDKYPYAWSALEKHLGQTDLVRVEYAEAKDGRLNFKITGERTIFLHSNYSPENEADCIVNGNDLSKSDSVVVFGFGLGYHVEKLTQKYPELTKIIVEPDPQIFLEVIKNKDITRILESKNLYLMVTEQNELVSNELTMLHLLGVINSVQFIPLSSYNQLYSEFWKEIKSHYIRAVRLHTVNFRTALASIDLWMENFFVNVNEVPNCADLADFINKFNSIPAVVVSAGPSLHKNIGLLKEVKDKALIIAAGSTVNAMQKADIKPHIMVGIDGMPITGRVYENLEWDDIYFAATLKINHQGFINYKGPKIYLQSTGEGHAEVLERFLGHFTPALPSGGSCAHVAMSLVKALGCDPVIFIGQDLAYTNMQTHADGRLESKTISTDYIEEKKLIKKKDIYGNDTFTDQVFLTLADNFERYIKMYPENHKFINATEGGISFLGAEVMPLQEAIDLYCNTTYDLEKILSDLYSVGREKNIAFTQKIAEFIEDVDLQGQHIAKMSKDRLKLLEKILSQLRKNHKAPKEKQRKRLFDLTEKVENEVFFKMFINPITYDALLAYKNNSETQAREKKNIIGKFEVLYGGLKIQYNLVDSVIEAIGRAIEKSKKYRGNGEVDYER